MARKAHRLKVVTSRLEAGRLVFLICGRCQPHGKYTVERTTKSQASVSSGTAGSQASFDRVFRCAPCSQTKANRGHRGFSLPELLIVMAILAAIAGMALPAMRGTLDKSRLNGAARQVQAALAKARSLAIREGVAVQFRCEIHGDRYVIERSPVPQALVAVLSDGTESGLSSQSAIRDELQRASQSPSGSSSPDSSGVQLLRDGTLPSGVVFGEPEIDSRRPGHAVAMAEDLLEHDSAATTMRHWSEPVRFLPSGRTTDCVFALEGQREFVVDVTLRGLTAMSSYSAPARGPAVIGSMDSGLASEFSKSGQNGAAP
jgi:prepilin-type N-terminal cleavage/methylation domain-containing protein